MPHKFPSHNLVEGPFITASDNNDPGERVSVLTRKEEMAKAGWSEEQKDHFS
jgi:hypothetical protein